jgi:hypothetical protein
MLRRMTSKSVEIINSSRASSSLSSSFNPFPAIHQDRSCRLDFLSSLYPFLTFYPLNVRLSSFSLSRRLLIDRLPDSPHGRAHCFLRFFFPCCISHLLSLS